MVISKVRAGGGGGAGRAQAHPMFGYLLSKKSNLMEKNLKSGTFVHTQYSVASTGPANRYEV